MAGFDYVEKCFCLFFVFENQFAYYLFLSSKMLNTAPNELEGVPLHAEFASSIDLPLPMLARKMIAETSEHNIYAGAGLSSPFRLSSVMILSFQFLLSLYDCTISTTLLVHLSNLNICAALHPTKTSRRHT